MVIVETILQTCPLGKWPPVPQPKNNSK